MNFLLKKINSFYPLEENNNRQEQEIQNPLRKNETSNGQNTIECESIEKSNKQRNN
jgi:hypothetical protein